ncbi:MAG TPA: class I SAM-dependent methyltransferase [Polyangiaceae bacterium]|jgi:methyltransferase (TIGR00027 family)|nr:class I SAM-dependent methyltransferase [Polyangiaceae bacterium]
MKKGRASRTAELVCMGRALAHGRTSVSRFSDPTALALLPEDTRASVERVRAGEAPRGLRGHLRRTYLDAQCKTMIARTVALDDAIREAKSPQLVILGAGLDGRAWRMPELRDVVVFEVDHADSQRDKRKRAEALTPFAREIRFVPVDFQRDVLDDALSRAGHDLTRPTTWIWEGVVMYLTPAEVEATLAVIQRWSAPQSRLAVVYHSPAVVLRLVGGVLRALGERLRSTFTASDMRALLGRYGFEVVSDADMHAVSASLSPELERATRMVTHQRVVVADHSR